MTQTYPLACHWKHRRIQAAHPCWWGCRSCGQIGCDAVFGQEIHHAVELVKVILIWPGFEYRPGKDVDGDHIDPGSFHQTHILRPYVLGPLLGIVVTSVQD